MIVFESATLTLAHTCPPNKIFAFARKFVPKTVRVVPPAGGPPEGSTDVIVGDPWYEKTLEEVTDCVSVFVTVRSTKPIPCDGVLQVMLESELTAMFRQLNPPIITAGPGVKPVPVMAMVVLPPKGPPAGDTEVIVGAEVVVYK